IPRNGIEAPLEGATVQSEGGHRAPCALEISAAISDDDRVASYRWRTRHEIVKAVRLALRQRVNTPDASSGPGIDRMQVAVDTRDIDTPLPDRESAVDDIAAGVAAPLAFDLWVVSPELLSVVGSNGIYAAPVTRGIHDSIDDNGGGFETSFRSEVIVPG